MRSPLSDVTNNKFKRKLPSTKLQSTTGTKNRDQRIKRYLTKCRSQLKPEIVASMIFLKENGAILKKHYEELTDEKGAVLPGIYDDFDAKPNSEHIEESLRVMAGDEVDMLDGGLAI